MPHLLQFLHLSPTLVAIAAPLVLLLTLALPAETAPSSVPFSANEFSNVISVQCTVFGKTLPCMIDSGSTVSMINSADVPQAVLKSARKVRYVVVGGSELTARQVDENVILGETKSQITLNAVPFDPSRGESVLLGEDFLSTFSAVTFDYKNHVVTFGH